jgi:hypothetical protein
MSATNHTADLSTANFTAIFDAASYEYKTLTKQDIETHPFAAAFENSNSPDSVMNIFRKQAQAFDKFRNGDDKLIAWLISIVNVLFTFSETLGEGIGLVSIQFFYDISTLRHLLSQLFSPAKTIFTGISVLLGVGLFPHPHMPIHIIFNSGSEGRYRELRSARKTFRAHTIFSSTPSSLHVSPTHTRDDGATRENHGPNTLNFCVFDQDNQRESNQLVYSIDILSRF